MADKKNKLQQFVVCIKNNNYKASLELFKIYRVVSDEQASIEGDLRIIDESGEDYLFPADYFIPIEVPVAVEETILHAS